MGVMLYEFVCGEVPFGEDQDDPYAIYEKVLERRLRYPSFFDSRSPAKAMIETLLDKNPNARHMGDYSKLKKHPWFSDLDWSALLRREIEPPYVPTLRNLDRDVNVAIASKSQPEDIFR
jgi:cGMP-dependent protein kinase